MSQYSRIRYSYSGDNSTFPAREAYLAHYGVSGMKKGQRRYQTEDGRLTAEGREHYGVGEKRATGSGTDKGFKKYSPSTNESGYYYRAKLRSKWADKSLERAKKSGNEKTIAKRQIKSQAYHDANKDLDMYRKNASAAKLFIQNHLLGAEKAHRYRHARARGSGRLASLIESSRGLTGWMLRRKRDNKEYGHYVWDDPTFISKKLNAKRSQKRMEKIRAHRLKTNAERT